MNASGLQLLKDFEGFREHAYQCPAGVWTIGFGFTDGVKPGDSITMADALTRLQHEIAPRESAVLGMCRGHTPTENQLAAMTSLAYNIGLHNFQISTVLRKHNAGEPRVAAAAFGLWNKSHNATLPGLTRRRAAEAALYLKES